MYQNYTFSFQMLTGIFSENYLLIVALIFIAAVIYQIFKPSIDFTKSKLLDVAFNVAFIFASFLIMVVAGAVFGFIPEWTMAYLSAVFPLLSALGILVGASLASLGVLKSIVNTQKIESEKLTREIGKNKTMLKMILINASRILHKYKAKKAGSMYMSSHNAEILQAIYESLIDKDILSVLDIESQKILLEIYNKLILMTQSLREKENFSDEILEGDTLSALDNFEIAIAKHSSITIDDITKFFEKNYPSSTTKDQ